jgi:GntR family transcriptional regulator
MKIKRESSVALYVQIAERLAQDIANGLYGLSERLPTEHELMERYDVSRVTVRQAITQLMRQGLVVSKQGKGTFVAGPVVEHGLEELKGFYDTLVSRGHAPETKLLIFGPMQAPHEAQEKLGEGAAPLIHLVRVYLLHGQPFALVRAWLPSSAQRVSWEEAERHPIYAILQTLLGMKVARADMNIVAHGADAEEAEILDLEPANPVLMMERTSYSNNGQALEFSRFSIRPENYRFCITAQGPLSVTTQIQKVTPATSAADKPNTTSRKQ